jgi:integrase
MQDHFRTKRERLDDHDHDLVMLQWERLPDADHGGVKVKRYRGPKRTQRLTDANVAALRKERRAYLVWDQPRDVGLAVLVQPTGSKSFYCYYQHAPGQPMKAMVLGKASVLTVEEAREKAREIRKKVTAGLDPRHGDPTRTLPFKELVEQWHTEAQTNNVSGDATKAFVLFHTSPWHNRPAGTIQRHEVSSLLQQVRLGSAKRKGAPSSSNRLHAHLSSLFSWALDEGLPGITVSPVKKSPPAEEALKGRDLPWFRGKAADAVLKAVWEAAANLDRDDQLFVKLLILLPKRRNALARMRWEQVDDNWHWRPIKGSANKKNLDCTLPQLARRIMGARQDEGPVMLVSEARAQKLISIIREATGIADWIWHGIRHIAATKLEEVPEDGGLGIAPHIARLVLDHPAASDVHAGYVHASYRRPVADALEAWAGYVERTVAPAAGVAVLR